MCVVSIAQAGYPQLPSEWRQARADYYQAIEGDKRAYSSACELFAQLYKERPTAPIIQVYYGSLRLLEANRTWAIWKKNTLSKEGVTLMDQAVTNQPDNLEVRFVRAVTTYHLPGFFHRKQQSKQDFAYLASQAVEAAKTGKFEPRLAAASLYFHGEFLEQAGLTHLAVANWESAITVDPASPAAQGSREKLKKVER